MSPFTCIDQSPFTCIDQNGQVHRDRKSISSCQRFGGILEGGVGMTADNITSFVMDENVLKLDSGDGGPNL